MKNSLVLYQSLKAIEQIYNESQYGVNDLYRIKDIIHSLDDNHWRSKQWLVRTFKDIYDGVYGQGSGGNFYIAGGWYGLLGYLLKEEYPADNYHVISADMDPMSDYYGKKIFPDHKFNFQIEDSTNINIEDATALISTSCEHIDREDLCDLIKSKKTDAFVVLQSNNYEDLDSHINCSESLDEFVEYIQPCLSKGWIAYKGALNLGEFERYTVIGQ